MLHNFETDKSVLGICKIFDKYSGVKLVSQDKDHLVEHIFTSVYVFFT